MEIPPIIRNLIEEGKNLEFLLAEVDLLGLEGKEKDDLAWEVEEAKIIYDLQEDKAKQARWLIYSSYFSAGIGTALLLMNRQSGESLFWPIIILMEAIVVYLVGRNIRNRRITIGRDRLIEKGYFKRF